MRRNVLIAVGVMVLPFAPLLLASQFAPSAASTLLSLIFLLAPVWIWAWGCVLIPSWFGGEVNEDAGFIALLIEWAKAMFLDLWFLFPIFVYVAWLS